ncbi:MAG TPA: glycogen debranching protein GlgX [Steroidobacteraceae bacterium]|jgi:glycogen operon protein|nr:glycogen debranching protein GlgX [Steroidobacteraceae bacterium]
MQLQPGSARPLGATWSRRGVNFAVYSSHATAVELCLFDAASGAQTACYPLPSRTGDVWHGSLPPSCADPGTLYAFRAHGPDDPENGHRFDPTALLLDPHARRLSLEQPVRSCVIDGTFDWDGDRPPATPWHDTVVYELHVKGYTRLHPQVSEAWRGKYLGLTVPAVIEHLRYVGVTAVELLPCQFFLSERFLQERGLTNYWGYNPIAWFAPSNDYAVRDAVVEFKTMIKALHRAGIEVILDVVFNHTAEGNESGPVLSFKGLDNSVYYRLLPDKRCYENLSGCGNTVNCEHPHVRASIVECLKYWVEEMHVDGFRFDLATVLGRDGNGFNERSGFFDAVRAEPALAYVKLIAEPWDVGYGGYQLGRFPSGWSEWNDRYRDTLRAFWRRDGGRVGELAERFAGSSDLFRHDGRKPTAGVNFVTAHDGFTLYDLVSYNERQNLANGENGADGHHGNLSRNCGVEGPSDDPAVRALRRRQMMNLLGTLLLSQGVPLLQAGDEFARTQRGNNNAYCQDNEISWIDWRLREANAELTEFVRYLTGLRRTHEEFRRETFLKGTASMNGVKDVTWLHPRGSEMTQDDWRDEALRSLGILFGKRSHATGRFLLLLNADDGARVFALPDDSWSCRFDTAQVPAHPGEAASLAGRDTFALGPNSAALLES